MTLFRKFFAVFILLSLAFTGNAGVKYFPVVTDGKAAAEIVPDENQACMEAAALLESYIMKSTGIRMDAPAGSPQIILNIEKGKMDLEGFRFTFPSAGKMVITGGGANGIRYGALEFLERFMGVRFLYPGPAGEHVPKLKNLRVPMKEFSDAPKYHTRTLFSFPHPTRKRFNDWTPLLRGCDPYRLAIGHNLYHMFPVTKYGKTNPEFYPVINGKRYIPKPPRHTVHWQPCMTNPAVIREAVRMICDAFAKNPDLRTWSLGQTDGNGFCECENCKKFYPVPDEPMLLGPKDRSVLYLQFCNRIAEGVTKKYPDAKLGIFAYNHTSFAPKNFKLHPALVPIITYDRLNWADPVRKAKDLQRQNGWSAIASELCWWDYCGANRYVLPRITPRHTALTLTEGYKAKVRHAFIQHTPLGIEEGCGNEQIWAEGPMAYVMLKMLWDPTQDVEKVLDDWYQTAVGPQAAPYLKRYFDRVEKFWTKDMIKGDWFKRCKGTYLVPTWLNYLNELEKGFFEKSAKDLDMVCKLAPAGDCKVRAEYFRHGFQLRRIKCEYWQRNQYVRHFSPKSFSKVFFKDNFEKGLGEWKIRTPDMDPKVSVVPKAGPDDSKALEMRFTATDGACIYKIFKIDRKADFRMEVKYSCTDTEKRAVSLISAEWCDEKGNALDPVFYSDILGRDTTGDWCPLGFNFTTPAQLPAYLKVQIGTSYSRKGNIRFDDFIIREVPQK